MRCCSCFCFSSAAFGLHRPFPVFVIPEHRFLFLYLFQKYYLKNLSKNMDLPFCFSFILTLLLRPHLRQVPGFRLLLPRLSSPLHRPTSIHCPKTLRLPRPVMPVHLPLLLLCPLFQGILYSKRGTEQK